MDSPASSTLPAQAKCVVIGAGIVGNSLLGHLAHLGWKDLVLIDKGPLPNPGGSTGHASNFIFPVDHSREMTDLTADSLRQYEELEVITVCGGIEVARTEERMEELRRRMVSAKSWGVEPVSLLTPAEVKELVPFIDESVILGGFYCPGVGVVDSLRAGTLMREEAQNAGALTVAANTEVTGIDVEVGSYAHRPILHDPDEIPSIEESALSPTELPFTQDDFTQQLEQALELMPEIVGDESVGIKY